MLQKDVTYRAALLSTVQIFYAADMIMYGVFGHLAVALAVDHLCALGSNIQYAHG